MTDHMHFNWEEVKASRDNPEYVTWTGKNADEVEAFALESNFGFTVGSYRTDRRPPLHKWISRLAAWLETISLGGNDKRLLEIYPDHPDDDTDDRRTRLEEIIKELEDNLLGEGDITRELRELTLSDDTDEYVPWHWTTAKPGDKIYRDGSVERGVNT